MYTDPTPSSAAAQVDGSSQSNGGWPEREPTRAGTPCAVSRCTTRRPVLPVPPTTSVWFAWYVLPIMMAPSGPVESSCRHPWRRRYELPSAVRVGELPDLGSLIFPRWRSAGGQPPVGEGQGLAGGFCWASARGSSPRPDTPSLW